MSIKAALVIVALLACAVEAHQFTPWRMGDQVKIQCKGPHGEWGPGPKCQETGDEMTFRYGVDQFFRCGWHIDAPETYRRFSSMLNQETNWNCRVAMTADEKFYLPFTIQLWGVTEPTHFHMCNHMNFIFHTDEGKIIGVSAYPVKDNFQMGRIGTTLVMHGPSKWFHRQSFTSAHGASSGGLTGSSLPLIVGWSFLSAMVCSVLFVALYTLYLKPKLTQKFLKKD